MDTLINTAEKSLRFILAGNARITFRSARSGTRFSYRVKASDDGKVHFVAVLAGYDNDSDYRYIGIIKNGRFIHGRDKAFANANAPSVLAFGWAFKNLSHEKLPETLEVFHQGRCGRCGRTLTVPESIESGLGPVCAEAA